VNRRRAAGAERALEKSSGNRILAARLLGISRRSLYYELEQYGIE
jgi:transcriptional regulator with PAS, ATPase and Fis domain